jgi:hypothetical protein
MAKSFKKLMSEVAQPKSAGERAFKDQHIIQRFDAQPSGQDHIFNGETPPKKRLADYMPGQDAAAYDKASKIPDDGDGSIVDTTNGPVAVESVEEDDEGEDLTEEPGEEKPMMMGSLRAMAHNLQGIARYIASTNDPEEWFQNKLAGVAREMQTLYGYATAETMAMGEDVDHKVDGRRLSFKEKAKKLGYVKTEPEVEEDAFAAKAAYSKMAGKDKMKMGDKEYPVTMTKLNAAKIKSACEEVEIEEKVNTKGIQKAVDDGKSMDAIMTMFANKRTTNTDEIRKVVKDYMWKKRMKKEEVELDEAAPKISKGTSKGSIMARGIRGKGMKKFDVDVSVDNGKFSFRITDESGKFQTVDIKKAARMLGEEYVAELVEAKKKENPKGKKLTLKQMRQALNSPANRGTPKDKVSLKKAPWDESVDLEEKFTIKTSILPLDSGEKVKVSRQDADLLNKFFKELNPRNSKEMRKVLVKDKAGYEEILGFAREAL